MKYKISNVTILTISIFNFLFSQDFNLSGYVKDSKSLEPLVGANVFIKGTSIGSSTNETGFYELKDLKVGQYIIKASYIGYSSFEDTLIITDGNINLDVANDFNKRHRVNLHCLLVLNKFRPIYKQ